MPTWERVARFIRDYQRLTPEQRAQFRRAVEMFVDDLIVGKGFRPGLRVKKMQGHDDVWELTWADDGRATFQYGPEVMPGHVHVVWRRIGTHDIFRNP